MQPSFTIDPVHPGEIIKFDILEPLGLSQNKFAEMLGVPSNRINAIIRGQRRISADTAVRLGLCLGNDAAFWLGLQSEYDLQIAKDALADTLENEVTVLKQSSAA